MQVTATRKILFEGDPKHHMGVSFGLSNWEGFPIGVPFKPQRLVSTPKTIDTYFPLQAIDPTPFHFEPEGPEMVVRIGFSPC